MWKNFKRHLNFKLQSRGTIESISQQCKLIVALKAKHYYRKLSKSGRLRSWLEAYVLRLLQLPIHLFVLKSLNDCHGEVKALEKFNWAVERLSLANFDSCQTDIDFINSLAKNKLCSKCKEKNMKYCFCALGNQECKRNNSISKRNCWKRYSLKGELKGKALIKAAQERNWEPYICKENFQIWKREEKNNKFAYKVYAYFADITAADLLFVQLDLEYRLQWDQTAVSLQVIETDPAPGSQSDLIYWELLWPKFFQNRDYVYCRRSIWDDKRKVLMIANRVTRHEKFPVFADKVRISDYWSLIVIKPVQDFHENGCHFMLTYFDDPGVPIPTKMQAWFTQQQMPEFLNKMHEAAKAYPKYSHTHKISYHNRAFDDPFFYIAS